MNIPRLLDKMGQQQLTKIVKMVILFELGED
jgi:hypothetical protein